MHVYGMALSNTALEHACNLYFSPFFYNRYSWTTEYIKKVNATNAICELIRASPALRLWSSHTIGTIYEYTYGGLCYWPQIHIITIYWPHTDNVVGINGKRVIIQRICDLTKPWFMHVSYYECRIILCTEGSESKCSDLIWHFYMV